MKFYNIDMQGRFLAQRVASDPSVNAAYEGRVIYNSVSKDIKIQTNTAWRKIWSENNMADLVSALNTQGGVLLDGQPGSYYRNANNLNAGTVPTDRLSGTYTINIIGNALTATTATQAHYA